VGALWPSLAAIAGAGPLVGYLAAQFGFAPGFLWILIGGVLAGCVQDFTVLVASVRHSRPMRWQILPALKSVLLLGW